MYANKLQATAIIKDNTINPSVKFSLFYAPEWFKIRHFRCDLPREAMGNICPHTVASIGVAFWTKFLPVLLRLLVTVIWTFVLGF